MSEEQDPWMYRRYKPYARDLVARPDYVIEYLRRMGNARPRGLDPVVRIVNIDDDDAAELAAYIDQLEAER